MVYRLTWDAHRMHGRTYPTLDAALAAIVAQPGWADAVYVGPYTVEGRDGEADAWSVWPDTASMDADAACDGCHAPMIVRTGESC